MVTGLPPHSVRQKRPTDEVRPTDRQTDKQINRKTEQQNDRQTGKQIESRTNGQTDKQTNRKTDKQTERQTNKQTDRKTDKQTERQTDARNCVIREKIIECSVSHMTGMHVQCMYLKHIIISNTFEYSHFKLN